MNFINNIYFEFGARRGKANVFPQIPYFVDDAIAGTINLDNIEMVSCIYRIAIIAIIARIARFAILAIYGFGQ